MTTDFTTTAIAPTQEQLDIQNCPDRSLLIEAAAGAAKTTSLALRISQAIKLGADPRSLLALTFTSTACIALRRALRFVAGEDRALSSALPKLSIETFDSYAAGVLRRIETLDGEDPVEHFHSAEQAAPFVWAAIDAVSANPKEGFHDELQLPSMGADSYVGEFLRRSASIKGRLLLELNPPESGTDTPNYAIEDLGLDYTLLRVLRRYEAHRIESGRGHANFRMPLDATYDLARLLLPETGDGDPRAIDPQSLPLGAFRGVFVDELHDCNEAMFTILKALLVRPGVHFCAVGDRHQVIHQHNGADARFMSRGLDLELGRKLRRLPLTLSFRYGRTLASWMSRHAGKPIAADTNCKTELTMVRCEGADLPDTDTAIVDALKAWRSEQRKDRVYEDCAVLLRHPSQSMLIENALHRERIAYRCEGFTTYLQRPEVLFVRCAFAVASGRLDTLGGAHTRGLIPAALFEITQAPVLRDGDTSYRSAEAFLRESAKQAADSEQVVASIFNEHILAWAPKAVQRRLRQAIAIAQQGSDSTTGCNFEVFIAALDMPRFAMDAYVDTERRHEVQRHMAGLLAASRSHAGALEFFKFLQLLDEENEQRLAGLAAGRTRSHKAHVPAITLASAAHVKGLEFEHVLLPYLRQGVFPQTRANAADERNLFYVAATRARSRLSLMVDAQRPSEFVP